MILLGRSKEEALIRVEEANIRLYGEFSDYHREFWTRLLSNPITVTDLRQIPDIAEAVVEAVDTAIVENESGSQ